MAWAEADAQRETIQKLFKEHRLFYQVLGGGVLVLIGVFVGWIFFAAKHPILDKYSLGYGTNLYTEFISIAVTVFIVDRLNQRREEQREAAREKEREEREGERRTEELKKRLVREAGSPDNGTALNAIRELSDRGWLIGKNGLLQNADLRRANLEGAKLERANLQGAELLVSKLQGAHLIGADLQDAELVAANLEGAVLVGADLQDAELVAANLEGAVLVGANLQGANLHEANLQEVALYKATFDENITLPDRTKWAPDTDMERFTKPEHPEFWRSDWELSPAYRGRTYEPETP